MTNNAATKIIARLLNRKPVEAPVTTPVLDPALQASIDANRAYRMRQDATTTDVRVVNAYI